MIGKPPKIVIPGMNRGAGIPDGVVLGRRRGTKQGPVELLDLKHLTALGLATTAENTKAQSGTASTAQSSTDSLSKSVSTSLSQISSSLSNTNSQVTSLSTAVSSVDSGQSVSLSQVSSSLSGAISSTTSLSTAVSTVISGSISTVNSRIDSLSTAGGGGGATTFLALTDTPASYVGQAAKVVRVNAGETALEFAAGTVDPGQSTSLSQISSSLSGAISSTTSLSTAVSTVDANQSTSLSQISSSLSGAISSTTSLSSAVSTVISGSISTVNSRIDSLSTAVGGGGTGTVTSIIFDLGLTGGTISTTGTVTAQTPQPQGRLTLVSATPVMTSDQTAKGTIYYAEYVGNSCPVYDGTTTRPLTFSNLSLVLDSTNHLIENLYDVYLWNNSGSATLGAGPAWINTATVTWTSASPGVCSWTAHGLYEGAPVIFTAGTSTPTGITAGTTYYVSKTGLTANAFSVSTSVANAAAGTNVNTSSTGVGTQTGTNHTTTRGTGAGTTELQMKNGIWTNKNAITLNNNSVSSGSIAANQATYLGTFYCTANGQTGAQFKPAGTNNGNGNILGLYNAYNRVPLSSLCRDTTVSWTYNSTTWRAANGSVTNRISFVDGLQQSTYDVTNLSHSNGTSVTGCIGINLDSTTASPNMTVQSNVPSTSTLVCATARELFQPQLGFHFFQAMEAASVGTPTFFGSIAGGAPGRQLNGLQVLLEM